jgi:hypothetical protein
MMSDKTRHWLQPAGPPAGDLCSAATRVERRVEMIRTPSRQNRGDTRKRSDTRASVHQLREEAATTVDRACTANE